jgi:hypothetical protein
MFPNNSVPACQSIRVAMLCLHCNPFDAPGAKFVGGMNVYIQRLVQELAKLGLELWS